MPIEDVINIETPGSANLNRLTEECKKLDPAFEQALAEEGMAGDFESWPEYCKVLTSLHIRHYQGFETSRINFIQRNHKN